MQSKSSGRKALSLDVSSSSYPEQGKPFPILPRSETFLGEVCSVNLKCYLELLPALCQASKTWRNVELKLNLPAVTAFNSIPQGPYSSHALCGSERQAAESCLEIFQCQNSVFVQQSTALEVYVLTLLEPMSICVVQHYAE